MKSHSLRDRLFEALTRTAGWAVFAIVLGLILVLAIESWPVLSQASSFQLFTSTEWTPKPPDGSPPVYGALAFIYGTVATSLIALVVAVPLGIAAAAFLAEIAPPATRRLGAFLVELLAAIPSVVYGFWGLFFLAPIVQSIFTALGGPNTGGIGILSAGLVLAIMILPYITAIGFEACRAVPASQREGALALGATRWQTIRSSVLPYARPGLLAGIFLALGRALGETMAVTMLIGNTVLMDVSLFATGDSIASKIANSLNEADDATTRSALIALALVLFGVTAVFNVAARLLLNRLLHEPERATLENDTPPEATPRLTIPFERTLAPLPAPQSGNSIMTVLLTVAFIVTVGPLFLILGQVTIRGVESLDANLFTLDASRPELTNEQFEAYRLDPTAVDELGRPLRRGGLGHAILGSLMMVGLASAVAIPLGLLAAMHLAESRSRSTKIIRFLAELLGGVPSIVIGIFIATLFVAPSYSWLRGASAAPLNFSGWAGAAALAILMIPVIVRSAEESLRSVPESFREASYALGASRMQTLRTVILPMALPAVFTGIILALARIAGETAPLLLTAGQSVYWPTSPSGPTPYLPGYLYNDSRSPSHDLQAQAWSAALVLLATVMVLNLAFRLLPSPASGARSRG